MASAAGVTRQKATGSHFTPRELARLVANRLVAALVQNPQRNLLVLDPACGNGELLIAFARAAGSNLLWRVELIGVDEDPSYANQARTRLLGVGARSTQVFEGDFLKIVSGQPAQHGRVPEEVCSTDHLGSLADVIIANPPYVRTQILGAVRAQRLARAFGLTGRVDLYHAFLVAMARRLRPGGLLGVITSNRFIITRGGAAARKLLASQFDVLEFIDLGDTKLFEAAVLPCVIIARRHESEVANKMATRFVKIYQEVSWMRAETGTKSGSLKIPGRGRCPNWFFQISVKRHVSTTTSPADSLTATATGLLLAKGRTAISCC
jgi:type I restriction-modification system DNA methylase subunit